MAKAAREGMNRDLKGMRIGLVKELGGEGFQPGVEARFNEAVKKLEAMGAEVVEVSCPRFKYALGAYYIIMPSEVSSNLARYDGMRYGPVSYTHLGGEHVVHGVRIDDRSGDAGLLESANVFLAARCRLLREQHVGQVTGDLQLSLIHI